jgi:hypothetical protein
MSGLGDRVSRDSSVKRKDLKSLVERIKFVSLAAPPSPNMYVCFYQALLLISLWSFCAFKKLSAY